MIRELKAQGRHSEIQQSIVALNEDYRNRTSDIPRRLCYLTGENREKYFHDMEICQHFATLNRRTIATQILKNLFGKEFDDYESFETVHNYIDFKDNIVRKGSVSAREGEILLI